MSVWTGMRAEVREVVWLASVISGLSIVGVVVGVLLALALDGASASALVGHV
jgi:hypothetical protein